MKLNHKITLIAFGISLIAKSSVAQNANDQSATGSPITAQHFVWEAATTDMKEIKMGELALEKSDNVDVKAFAEHLIADHKKVISSFEAESKNGSDADIRGFADSTLHTLRHHLDEAEKCHKMMKGM